VVNSKEKTQLKNSRELRIKRPLAPICLEMIMMKEKARAQPGLPQELPEKEAGTKTEQLSFKEIESLMDHDSYRRVNGKIRQIVGLRTSDGS
jgi:hypothetical protein